MNEDTWGLDDFVPMEVTRSWYITLKKVNFKINPVKSWSEIILRLFNIKLPKVIFKAVWSSDSIVNTQFSMRVARIDLNQFSNKILSPEVFFLFDNSSEKLQNYPR